MSVIDRSDLEASPLADLHVIASELGLDGFRRMRKADLIDAIVERQGGGDAAGSDRDDGAAPEAQVEAEEPEAEKPEAGKPAAEKPAAEEPQARETHAEE